MNLNSTFDQVAADVAGSFSPIAMMNWDPVDPEEQRMKDFFQELEMQTYDHKLAQWVDYYLEEVKAEGIKQDNWDECALDRARQTLKLEQLEKARQQEDRRAKAIADVTATMSLPGTIIQPTLKRTLSLSPELLTSAFNQKSAKAGPSISKVSFPSPIRELSAQSQSLLEDGMSIGCAAPFSKPSTTVPRKRRVMPTLVSALPRRELDRFVQAQLAADQIWLQLSKLSSQMSHSEILPTNSQSSTSTTIEASSALSDFFPSLENSRPMSTGITDPLEAARVELRAMRLLLRTGKIQLTSGGTVIKGSRML